jgi:hypothetical protein
MCKADNVSKTSTITFLEVYADWNDDLGESRCVVSPDKERRDSAFRNSRLLGTDFILYSIPSNIPNDNDENTG